MKTIKYYFIICLLFTCGLILTSCNKQTGEIKFKQSSIDLFVGYETNLEYESTFDQNLKPQITIKDESICSYDLTTLKALSQGSTEVTIKVNNVSSTIIVNVYDLKLNLDGGKIEDFTYILEDETFNLPTPSKVGYTFLGWSYSLGDTNYVNSLSTSLVLDLELYANYQKLEVVNNITYNLDGGTLPHNAPTTYTEGVALKLPIPTKDLYEFSGWTIGDETQTKEWITTNYTGDLTLTAHWKEITVFSIKYEYNEGSLSTHQAESFEEFKNFFFQSFYKWSKAQVSYQTFVDDNLNSWSKGTMGKYNLFKEDCPTESDEKYFINCLASKNTWKLWFDEFDRQVNSINKDQHAWNNTYVATLRLNSFLRQSESYWNTTRTNALVNAILVETPLINYYNLGDEFALPGLIIDDGREFLGWYDENDQLVSKITKDMRGNLLLHAKWSPSTPVTSFNVINPITEIYRFDEHLLKYEFNEDATNKKVVFSSSDENILTVDAAGKIYGVNFGSAKVTIIVLGNEEFNVSYDITVKSDLFIDGNFETVSYVEPENSIKILAKVIGGNNLKVTWESKNNELATVDENGVVSAIKPGYVEIVAKVNGHEDVNLSFGVTIIPFEESEFFSVIAKAHNPVVNTYKNIDVAYVYLTDVTTSVSDLLFNYDYKVNTEYLIPETKKINRPGTKIDNMEFITVHYTAGASSTDTALSTARYFYNLNNEVSAQYCTGNDGIYMNVPDGEVGYHAGDGTGTKFVWINTGVKADANVKPIWGVVKNQNSSTGYYFTLNNAPTTIEVPTTGKRSNGQVATMTDPSKCFTFFGPAWKVVDGYYYMGNTWACFTQTWSGAISSRGGNLNSVGIETACNKGSDLWLTYQITSQLVARLLDKYNLDLSRVVGHNMFSGKDCPQTLLYRNGEMWYPFMECVEAELAMYQQMKDYTITCTSNDLDILDHNGRIKFIPRYTRTVSYTVNVTNNLTGVTKVATFSTVINGTYTK